MREIGIGLSEENKQKLNDLLTLHKEGRLEGMFENIPSEIYHHPDMVGISNSGLGNIDYSLRHFLSAKIKRIDELKKVKPEILNMGSKNPYSMDALLFGSYFHDTILIPEYAEKTYSVFDESFAPQMPTMPKFGRTKEEQAQKETWIKLVGDPHELSYENWKSSFKGKIAVNKEDNQKVAGMKNALYENPYFKRIMEGAKTEVTFFKICEETGVLRKCRADILNLEKGFICDLKSTGDASLNSFSKSMVNYNYDRQAAYYVDVIADVIGKKLPFVFIAVEKNDPFGVSLFNTPENVLEVGRELYKHNLKYYKSALMGDIFDGYTQEIQDINLPAYGYDVASRKRK